MSAPPETAQVSVFTDEQVVDIVDRREAARALRDVLVSAHRGTAHSIPKTMAQFDDASTAHSLGAIDLAQHIVAFKSWVNTPNGASAMLTLFDSVDGRTLAVMSAGALGMLRTAAAAAVATDLMADPAADRLAILGTGRQALHQVAAIHDVRPLEVVRVWSPRERSRIEFAERIESTLGVRAEAARSAQSAVADAPIVTAVTRATEPFLEGHWLAHGAHLNAVGAILPSTAELMPSVLRLSTVTAVDDIDNARRGSRELREHFGPDLGGVITLGEIVHRAVKRPDNPRLTVYKGLGSGLTDLAVAAMVWRNSTITKDLR
ncbi:ornithine cyclodeaminase [Rhodococcoides trifolii]|uniref:Ornithine cyclodeaminase n=1 Tax=Rhodococcoides trifolii TaxID=908250 RepID=A0A917G0H1_9NOCA|nr:ornithine cyclodeaminase family protein [Rhodococcus trifolii]GGG16532.1 ornithine cyclodeaminase [Rhodococcus trifolii]